MSPRSIIRISLSLLLFSALISCPASMRSKKISAASTSPLTTRQQALHVLDRLSFGPGPGDVERVEASGVDAWIKQQLWPGKIDDTRLEAMLASYPAMRLNTTKRIEMYPPSPLVRAVRNGRLPEPSGAFEHSVYADQIERIETRRAAKQGTAPAANGTAGHDSPSIAVQQDRIDRDLDAVKTINLPPQQRFNQILAMKPEEAVAFFRSLGTPERTELVGGMTPQQKELVLALENPTAMIGGEVMTTRLLRDLYSRRQLEAVMSDFWLNHFNIYIRKGPLTAWYLADYQDGVVLPHALGRFEDLLVAVAKSPAMLDYLDNASSIGPHSLAAMRASIQNTGNGAPGLNENYARELMELHTLGVNGGYTQQDVVEVAKVFTGWTVERPLRGGGFAFDPHRHEPGTKIVLGHKIHESGEAEGMAVLHLLASSPATAHFLSTELAQRFVSDSPPPILVDRMAATYLRTGGEIREVLRTMFNSPEFWSESVYRAKVKTPEEFVFSAVRATGGDVVRPTALLGALRTLGMPLYGCQQPNGYSWMAADWVNAGDLLNRMNFAMALAHNRAGAEIDYSQLVPAGDAGSLPTTETSLGNAILAGQLSPQTRNALLKRLEGETAPVRDQNAVLVSPTSGQSAMAPPSNPLAATVTGLILGSPDFQRR